jgi:hypothetical protein
MPYKRDDSPVWWVSFTDPSGKRIRRSTGTTDRKEAEALEAKWCAGGDSNPHVFRHWNLNPARLPIPPPALGGRDFIRIWLAT